MKKKKKMKIDGIEPVDQDDTFYFIAGYTDGGAPFGITWEEFESEERREKAAVELKELKLTKVQMQELVEDYDLNVDSIDFFLNVETGETIALNIDEPDEEDEELSELIDEGFNEIYFSVPTKTSDEGYEDMVAFTTKVSDERLLRSLVKALDGGRGVFRRFKEALSSDAEELERYYSFVNERDHERILDWLESIGYRVVVTE